MRYKAIVLAVSAAVSISVPAVAMASPKVSAVQKICLQQEVTLCVDHPSAGTQLQVDSGYVYEINSEGSVQSGANGWPFSVASWNTRYAGHAVDQVNDGTNCMKVIADSTKVTIGTSNCGVLSAQSLWVESGNWLINVYATDNSGQSGSGGSPSILSTDGLSRGDHVWAHLGNSVPNAQEQWNYGE